jgi:hypothetical protein
MKELLHEQSKRRNELSGGRDKDMRMMKTKEVHSSDGGWVERSSSVELSCLVKSIQEKVSTTLNEPKRKNVKRPASTYGR